MKQKITIGMLVGVMVMTATAQAAPATTTPNPATPAIVASNVSGTIARKCVYSSGDGQAVFTYQARADAIPQAADGTPAPCAVLGPSDGISFVSFWLFH